MFISDMFIYASYAGTLDVAVYSSAEECLGLSRTDDEAVKPQSSENWTIDHEPITEKEVTYKKLLTALESGKVIDYNDGRDARHYEKKCMGGCRIGNVVKG